MFSKVLVLAPHTDDGELGCGALIAKCVRLGKEVHYVAFSSCEESVPSGYPADILIHEMHAAMKVLGVPERNTQVLNFRVRRFEEYRQEILDAMIKLERDFHPDIVLSPSTHDVHQDHATIAAECLRAFKRKTILQYEIPWNNYTFDNQLFCVVDEEDVELKVKAVKCYQTQSNRSYVTEAFLRGNLITHGVQIGASYAEVFEIPRLILHGDMMI